MEKTVKWMPNLSKLLECPICFEIKIPIYLCELGHNICEACSTRIHKCPLCEKRLTKARNFCAENIFRIFNDLKQDFINDIEKNFRKITLSNTEGSLIELGDLISRSWGLFPCLVETCNFNGCFEEILQHFKNQHPKKFEQVSNITTPITKQWKLSKRRKLIYKSVFIKNVGFFLLYINIDENGYLKGTILMYASRSVAKKISYRFEVMDGEKKWILKRRKILTCRTPVKIINAACLNIPPEEIFDTDNILVKPLTCTVYLKQQIMR